MERNKVQAGQAIPAELQEQPPKAKVLNVYYSRFRIDSFYFCRQCKDYFETARATKANRTFFAASFFQGNISIVWAQFKRKHQAERVVLISWTEFKAFF